MDVLAIAIFIWFAVIAGMALELVGRWFRRPDRIKREDYEIDLWDPMGRRWYRWDTRRRR